MVPGFYPIGLLRIEDDDEGEKRMESGDQSRETTMLRHLLCSMVALGFMHTSQAAQCTGSEGINGEWSVEWNKRGASKKGEKERWTVRQTNAKVGTITANLDVTRNDRTLSAEKSDTSDGNNCKYVLSIDGPTVDGTYNCPLNGGPYRIKLTCDWQE